MASPRMVVLMGLPGSGKTTLATWLAERRPISVVSRDVIRSAMFPACAYTLEEKHAAFRAMLDGLRVNLRLGRDVCTDGHTFSRKEDLDRVLAVGEEAGARVAVFYCDCPVDLAQQRVQHDLRRDPRAPLDRDADLVAEVAGRFQAPPPQAVFLDMRRPVAEIGAEVIGCLDKEASIA